MLKRYAIWDKKSQIITPTGKVFTAEQWIEEYPAAALDHIKVVCSAGEINGGFFGTLGSMKLMYEAEGCDFSKCITDEDILAAIEAFEDGINSKNSSLNQSITADALTSIAASLEYQNMMSLPDVEV